MFVGAPFLYDGYDYGNGCYWLRRNAAYSGSSYWWGRYEPADERVRLLSLALAWVKVGRGVEDKPTDDLGRHLRRTVNRPSLAHGVQLHTPRRGSMVARSAASRISSSLQTTRPMRLLNLHPPPSDTLDVVGGSFHLNRFLNRFR